MIKTDFKERYLGRQTNKEQDKIVWGHGKNEERIPEKVLNMKLKENANEEDPRSIREQQVKKDVMLKEGRTWKEPMNQKKF